MRVKKFEAKSMKEALQMVKKELGPDAVILGARDNSRGFGIAGQASVEITAAVSESTLQKKRFVESRLTTKDREKFEQSDARTQRSIIEKMVERRLKENEERVRKPITSVSYIDIQDEEMEMGSNRRSAAYDRAAGRNVSDLLNDFDQDFADESRTQTSDRALSRIRNSVKEAVRHNALFDEEASSKTRMPKAVARVAPRTAQRTEQRAPQTTRTPSALNAKETPEDPKRTVSRPSGGGLDHVASAEEEFPASEKISNAPIGQAAKEAEIVTLRTEITRLQQMIETFQKVPQTFVGMHPGADYGIPYDLSFMFQKLVDSGVTIDNTVDILQIAAKEIDPVALKKAPIVDAWVARWFLSNTHVVKNPWQGRLHLFLGAAGSGKTSMLVKMASHLVVKEKKKIAILSTDSFKVGAVDQLKIYCQILNVPFAVLRNRRDWEWVLGQLFHVDHILVDFPGLHLRDLDEIHLLKSLLPPHAETQEGAMAPISHFCVSATTKDGDAYEIARRYRVAEPSDIIFTNLDQSVQHGIIHGLQKKMGKPLHSFGIGPRVPEDFEVASKERVLDLIFKLTKLRRETK